MSERITVDELHRLFASLDKKLDVLHAENRSEIRRMGESWHQLMRDVGEQKVRVENIENDLGHLVQAHADIRAKVDDTVKNAAFVSGGIGVIAFLSRWWPFGH